MTTDAVWNGGMGTLAIHLERRKGKGGSTWDGATRHGESGKGGATEKGEAMLSCRSDGSPVAVIVMRAWLAVAGVPQAAFALKRSCLPLPRLAKAGQGGLGAGNT